MAGCCAVGYGRHNGRRVPIGRRVDRRYAVTPATALGDTALNVVTASAAPDLSGLYGALLLAMLVSVIAGFTAFAMWYLLVRKLRRGRPLAYLYRIDQNKVQPFVIRSSICRIGRHRQNDIRFPDLTVSRFHGELIRNGVGTFTLVDRSSSNGIRVGNRPVRSAVLRDGEFVEIGTVRLRFSHLPRDFQYFEDTEVVETPMRNIMRRRITPRQFMTIDVRLYNDQVGWVQGRIRDLSARGAFIETNQKDLIPRTPIDMLFPTITGTDRRWFRVPGEVVRENRAGVGIAFYELDSAAINYIRSLSEPPGAVRLH